jgi:DNA mismatch repair protein MutS
MNEPLFQSQSDASTPLMRQYTAIKEKNPGTLLLYRMGDFYELFNEDAKIASKVLGLTLTSRNHGGAENVPLAGFPHHAIDRYANRLVKAGHKIAICEQTEDPKNAKGIVRRDIIEIITAGTATENGFIDEKSNNFIMSIASGNQDAGIGICDLSTGLFQIEEVPLSGIAEELSRIDPTEIIVSDVKANPLTDIIDRNSPQAVISFFDSWKFSMDNAASAIKSHFSVTSLEGLGLERYGIGICAAGALLVYLKEHKKNDLRHITSIIPRSLSQFAELDPSTIRNLELIKPMHTDDSGGTLISIIDRTSTAMGARLLKYRLTHPLMNIQHINKRLDSVEWIKKDVFVRGEAEIFLRQIADIERLIGRVMFERANARDMTALKQSLLTFPKIVKLISAATLESIAGIREALTGFETIVQEIDKTIVDDPPLSLREGNIIKAGISAELDEVHDASVNGKKWIAQLQETERRRTSISTLKVGYNRVFGYYIEISRANAESVPENYIRKQTLANGERFITPELKEMESKILGAEEKCQAMEYDIFVKLRQSVASQCVKIQKASQAIAKLDVYVSLARIAAEYGYVRPVVNEGSDIVIKDGRHPVVERMGQSEQFVPNDLEIKSGERQVLLITGPNMAGKSTYLRQNALIAIMAQMGSFVPAAYTEIGIVDKFYTRVGASDRLARGQSTFLVEMMEVANILNNATARSFVLLDEVGRGTSTFDGISIAWSVAEYLHQTPERAARTLFATHYHELTEMALLFPRIKNVHIKVKEWNDRIIFLRKIDEGSCDHSYGIQVARLAGVPKPVIMRAKEILANLENMELTPDHKPVLARHKNGKKNEANNMQTDMFAGEQLNLMDSMNAEIIQQLQNINIDNMTPVEALMILSELKKKANS